MPRPTPEDLGEPDLVIAGFQLWIHGRSSDDADDYWDGNWLRVTAHCGASGASVWVHGAILMLTDIVSLGDGCQQLLRGSATIAKLEPHEPYLRITIEPIDRLGRLRASVEITPDHMAQSHSMSFDFDPTYLPAIIAACTRILNEYPLRGV